MIWPTNYYKLAAATMFTLFFGGRLYAPKAMVRLAEAASETDTFSVLTDDEFARYRHGELPGKYENIQTYLQGHYFNALKAMICRLGQEDGLLDSVVCGYDTLNEPSGGFLGYEDVSRLSVHQELRYGQTPTALQAMLLGEGLFYRRCMTVQASHAKSKFGSLAGWARRNRTWKWPIQRERGAGARDTIVFGSSTAFTI
jgi:hypothetical protein